MAGSAAHLWDAFVTGASVQKATDMAEGLRLGPERVFRVQAVHKAAQGTVLCAFWVCYVPAVWLLAAWGQGM